MGAATKSDLAPKSVKVLKRKSTQKGQTSFTIVADTRAATRAHASFIGRVWEAGVHTLWNVRLDGLETRYGTCGMCGRGRGA